MPDKTFENSVLGTPDSKINPATGLQDKVKTPNLTNENIVNIITSGRGNSMLGGGKELNVDPNSFSFQPRVGADNFELRAQDQPVGQELLYGAGRLVGTTATKFLEGIGYIPAASVALFDKELMSDLLDNSWVNFWGNAEQSIKDKLPIYHTNKYNEGNIFKQMGTLGFWMDDVVDGLAFLASAAIGSKGISAVGKSIGAYGKIAQAYSKATQMAKLGKVAKGGLIPIKNISGQVDMVTMSLGNSAIEAGFEAKDTKDELLAQGVSELDAAKAAQGTYLWNMGVLMVPNYITNSMLFGKLNPLKGRIKRVVGKEGSVVQEVKPLTKMQKVGAFAGAGTTSMVSEGAWEENIQLAIQNYFQDKAEGKESDGQFEGIFNNWAQNWTTDEGQKSIALGAIIGLVPGGIAGVRQQAVEKKNEIGLQTLLGHTYNYVSDQINKRDIYLRGEDGKIVIDEKTGQQVKDPLKMASAFITSHLLASHINKTVEAIQTGNDIMLDRLDEELVASLALAHVPHAEGLDTYNAQIENFAREKVKSMTDKGQPVDEKEVKRLAEQYKRKGELYKTLYDNVDQVFAGNYDFFKRTDNKATDTLLFNLANQIKDNAIRTQFMGSVDQLFWSDKIKEIDNEIARTEQTVGDTELGKSKVEQLKNRRAAVADQIKESEKIVKKILEPGYWQKTYDAEAKKIIEATKPVKTGEGAATVEEPKPADVNPVTGEKQVKTETPPAKTVDEEIRLVERGIVKELKGVDELEARKESVVYELSNRNVSDITGAETAEELASQVVSGSLLSRYGDGKLAGGTLYDLFVEIGPEGTADVVYNNMQGVLFIDSAENEVVFKELETDKEYIVGKTTDRELFNGNLSVSDLGIIPIKHTVFNIELDPDGVGIHVQGRRYNFDNEDPFSVIEEDNKGLPIAVTLKDMNGVPMRFTNPTLVEELAYSIELLAEARETAYKQYLNDLESDFVVVRDPRRAEDAPKYYIYYMPDGSKEVVRPSTEVDSDGIVRVSYLRVDNPGFRQILIDAHMKDIHTLMERMVAEQVALRNRETAEQKVEIEKKLKDEITEFIRYSRSATAKEIIEGPTTNAVSNLKTAAAKKIKQPKVAKTTAGAKDKSTTGSKSSTGQPETSGDTSGGQVTDDKTEVTKKKSKKKTTEDEIVEDAAEKKAKEPVINKREPEPSATEFEPDDTEVEELVINKQSMRSTPHPETGAAWKAEDNDTADVYLSNPDNDLDGLTAIAEIDYKATDPDWKEGHRKSEYIKEHGLKVFKIDGVDNFDSPVDMMAIKITFYDKDGNHVKELDGMYVHKSNFANVETMLETEEQKEMLRKGQEESYKKSREKMVLEARKATRYERIAMIKDLLAGNEVVLTGWEKGTGTLNQTRGENRSLNEVFDTKQGFMTIADGMNTLWDGKGNATAGRGNTGNNFWTTTETANGQQRSVKLNNNKLSEEHAKILLKAYIQYALHGVQAIYNGPEVTGGLTVGEVINYLVLEGPVTNKSGKPDQSHLVQKTLYVSDGFLHYGRNTIDLRARKITAAQEKAFVDHMALNKNYNTPLATSTKTGTGIGSELKKDFTIGSIKGSKGQTYESFLINNGMVQTDAIKDPVTGRVFSKPIIYHAPFAAPKPPKAKPAVEEKAEETEEKKVEKTTKKKKKEVQAVAAQPDTQDWYQVKRKEDFKNVPVGTDIFLWDKGVYGTETAEGKYKKSDIGDTISVIGRISVNEKGEKIVKMSEKIESHNKEAMKHFDGMKLDDPKLADLFTDDILGGSHPIHAEIVVNEENEKSASLMDVDMDDDIAENLRKIRKGSAPFAHEVPVGRPYTKGDIDKAIANIRKKLGPSFTIKIEEDFIKVVTGAKTTMAFGTFEKDSITLSKKLAKGTEYEEAFHRVSLLYLTPEEQQQIYKETRTRDGMSDMSDRQVNEKLASMYRQMEKTGHKIIIQKNLTGKIKQFFLDLYDFIATLFTGRLHISNLDINNLFRVMGKSDGRLGRLWHAKPIPSSYALLKRGDVYTHTVKGRQLTHVKDTAQLTRIVDNLVSIIVNAGGVINTKEIGNIRYMDGLQPTKDTVALAMSKAKAAQEAGKTEMAEHYEDIAGLYQEIADNYDIYLDLMKSQIEALGIRTILPENPEDENDMRGNNFQRYEKAAFEVAGRDNAGAAIKLVIATLPSAEGLDEAWLEKLVDYDAMFDTLLNDLSEMNTVEEMVEFLKAQNSPPYQELVKRLEDDRLIDKYDTLHTQFFHAMRKNRYKYMNGVADLKGGKAGITILNAETQKVAYTQAVVWGQAFLLSDAFKNGVPNKVYLTKIINSYLELHKQIKREYYNEKNEGKLPSYKQLFSDTLKLFESISVPIDKDVLNNILARIDKTDKHAALYKFIVTTKMAPLFGDRGAFASLRNEGKVVDSKGRERVLYDIFKNEQVFTDLIAPAYNEVHGGLKTNTILGPDGNPYYLLSENSYLTDLFHALRVNPSSGVNYNTLSKVRYNGHSYLLKQLANKAVRDKVEIVMFSALSVKNAGDKGRSYADISDVEDTLIKMGLFEKDIIVMPQLGDRGHLYNMMGLKPLDFNYLVNSKGQLIIPDDIVDQFYGYAQDEYNQIQDVRKAIDTAIANGTESTLVENIHFDAKKGRTKAGYENANGLKYQHFTEFNGKNYNLNDSKSMPKYKTIVRKVLEQRIQDAIDLMQEQGIIGVTPGGVLFNRMFDEATIIKQSKDKFAGKVDVLLRNKIANFQLNTIMSTIESEKVVFMSPAYYKDLDDKIKRYTAIASTGTTSRMSFPDDILSGDRLLHNNDNFVFSVLKTQKYDAEKLRKELLPKFVEVYKARGYTQKQAEARAEKALDGYTSVDPTDAQAYITPHMFRALHIRLGEWTDLKEEAYKLILENRGLTLDEQKVVDDLFMQPLKFGYFGPHLSPGTARPILLKMSLATLTPKLVEKTQLESLYKTMMNESNPIDMVTFDTAVKVGISDKTAYYATDENGKPNTNLVNELDLVSTQRTTASFQYLRRQTITDPHNELRDVVKTQFRKVALSNIVDDREYTIGEDSVTGAQLKDENKTMMGELSDRGVKNFLDQLGVDIDSMLRTDPAKLFTLLRTRARMSGMPDALVDALAEQFDGERYELDALPDRKWLQSTLISMLGKSAVDLKLPGTSLIQMANFGLRSAEESDELRLIIPEGEEGAGMMEAMVSIEVFRDAIPNYNNLTYEERLVFANAMFTGIGYRVPTQGLVSTVPLKIVGFLPETSTATIVLPSEFTTLTGSDFDIDKLYFIRSNYEVVKGQPKKIEYLTDKNSTVEKRLEIFSHEAVAKKARELKAALYTVLADMYGQRKEVKAALSQLRDETVSTMTEETDIDSTSPEYLKELERQRKQMDKRLATEWKDLDKMIADQMKELNAQIEDERQKWLDDHTKEFITERTILQQNTNKAIENRLVDSYYAVLLSNDHIVDNYMPLDATTGLLKGLSTEVAELEGKTRDYPSLYTASHNYQSEVKHKYIWGKKGIGPFARANVHHILGQIAGIHLGQYIGVGNTIEIDGEVVTDLSQMLGTDKESILDWLSALINAHVDIAKDAYIFDLNVNNSTYGVGELLVRAGVGEDAFLFLAQPILKEYALAANTFRGKLKPSRTRPLTQIRKKYQTALNKARIVEKIKDKVVSTDEIFNKKRLKGDINVETPHNAEYYARQLQILNKFSELNELGTFLFEAVEATQVDTKRYGNNLAELRRFNKLVNKVLNDNVIKNMDKVFDMTFIGPYYQNSVILGQSLFKDTTVMASDAIYALSDRIMNEIGQGQKLNQETLWYLNHINDEIFSAIAGRFFVNEMAVSEAKLEEMMFGENSMVSRLNSIKNNNAYADNALIKMLQPWMSFIEGTPDHILTFTATETRTKWAKDRLIESWAELISSDNAEVSSFAKDLVTYSYFTSGFQKGMYSIYHYIPPAYLKEIGYSKYMKTTRLEFNDVNNYGLTEGIHDDVFQNLWREDEVVPNVQFKHVSQKRRPHEDLGWGEKYPFEISLKDVPGEATIVDQIGLGYNMYGELIYKPFIKMVVSGTTQLYKFVGYLAESKEPVYVLQQKKGMKEVGKVVKEHGLSKSVLPDNQSKDIPTGTKLDMQGVLEDEKGNQKVVYDFRDLVLISPEAMDVLEPISEIEEDAIFDMEPGELLEDYSQQTGETIGTVTSPIKFTTSKKTGYPSRTVENAQKDVTLAFAINFESAGEKLTKKAVNEAGKIYLPIPITKGPIDAAKIQALNKLSQGMGSFFKELAQKIEDAGLKEKGIDLNIAGNSMHTLSQNNYSQADANLMVKSFLQGMLNYGIKINSVVTGGQTGMDEAGAVAASELDIPTEVHAPADWRFRGADAVDINDEKAFKARFTPAGSTGIGETKIDGVTPAIQEETNKKLGHCNLG